MAEPFLPGSVWTCLASPAGWATYGPPGSSVAIPGTGAHVIDASGYDRPYPGGYVASGYAGYPVGAFFQVPPCMGGGAQVAAQPATQATSPGLGAPTSAAGPAIAARGCGSCAKPAAVTPSIAAAAPTLSLAATVEKVTAAVKQAGLPWWVWVLALVAGAQL